VPGSFNTGFGRALYGNAEPPTPAQFSPAPTYVPNSPLEDPQRGEMVFDLYDGSTLLGNLPLRYITKVSPHPSSRSEIEGYVTRTKGQTLAFVDIPLFEDLVDDKDYRIVVSRHRRIKGNPNDYEAAPVQNVWGVPWHGWGDESPAQSPHEISIFIRAASGTVTNFTPLEGWELSTSGLQGEPVSTELQELAPYPDFELRVPPVGSTQTPPAAWKIELGYIKGAIRIRGVSLRRTSASEALVIWDADETEPVECFAGGVLKIQVMDPERLTEGVRVAYDLRNFESGACALRATASSFTEVPGTFQAWDENGVDITASSDYGIDASGFF
jgi:hypothetical protein